MIVPLWLLEQWESARRLQRRAARALERSLLTEREQARIEAMWRC